MGPTPTPLLTSGGHHWRPVQTCLLEDLHPSWYWHLVVATETHSITNYQEDGTHLTWMLSCPSLFSSNNQNQLWTWVSTWNSFTVWYWRDKPRQSWRAKKPFRPFNLSIDYTSCLHYRSQTKLRKGNVFTSVCQEICPQGRPRRKPQRTVRILLECILVKHSYCLQQKDCHL